MQEKILIVDDDEILCQGIAEILTDEGYSVQNTSVVDDAQHMIQEHIYDIALFDYKMPGLTGVDLLKKIKSKNSCTKVFIMTGRPFIEKLLEQEKVSHIVSGILIKPFNDVLLLKMLKN